MVDKPSTSDLDRCIAPLAGSETLLAWQRPERAPFRLAGFPWFEHDRVFRRLPLVPPGELPESVDVLANCTAGGQIAFQSDAKHLAIRVDLAGPADMDHMPATGQCGFDLYTGPPFRQRFHSVSRSDHRQATYESLLFEHPKAMMRDFTLNFPLYQGVKRVQIGLTPEARIAPPAPYAATGRIVVYGTSITQGGCASRPGMAYTNILSRALNAEVVNLGFSGSGKGEPVVARTIAQIANPGLFVLDYQANQTFEGLRETLPEFVEILRDQHEKVPVLVVSRIAFARDITHAGALSERERSRDMQARLVATMREKGDQHLHFFDGSDMLGDDFDECTVDGVHLTDLGFLRVARGLEEVVRRLSGIEPPEKTERMR